MSKSSENNNANFRSTKYYENGTIEEGRISQIKICKTSNANGNGNGNVENKKWPTLCDANPYIIDILKNLFNKEQKSDTSTTTSD